jgi:hypothetical protein
VPSAHLGWPEFFKQLWQVVEVGEAAAAGQHQGLGETLLVYLTAIVYLDKRSR